MAIAGYACIVVAVLWILFKVRLAYQSEGGRMVVTVYDAAFYPPLIVVGGLFLINWAGGADWSPWIYVGLVPALIAAVAGIIKLAEELGDRQL